MLEQHANGNDPAEMTRLVADARAELDRTRRLQGDVSALLSKMAAQGEAAREHYQQVLGGYQELGVAITEATRAIKEHEQAQPVPAGDEITGDFAGVSTLTRPLGPPGGPAGMVCTGDEVANLQRFLARAGLQVTENGRYDEITGRAVAQLQRQLRLPADGKVGAATRKAINELLARG